MRFDIGIPLQEWAARMCLAPCNWMRAAVAPGNDAHYTSQEELMTKRTLITAVATLALGGAVNAAMAQSTTQSTTRIPITKDGSTTSTTSTTTTTTTSNGTVSSTSTGEIDWTGPLGYTLRPGGAPVYCAPNDPAEVAKIQIKTDNYNAATMISPEQAKALALCAVPGQLASGSIENANGRPVYEIDVLPTDKKTATKVEVDATTGEVINAKQYGGLRGLAAYLRESTERKNNKVAP
jgi:hypothetical protein